MDSNPIALFSTAGGRSIQVSKEAIRNAIKNWQDKDNIIINVPVLVEEEESLANADQSLENEECDLPEDLFNVENDNIKRPPTPTDDEVLGPTRKKIKLSNSESAICQIDDEVEMRSMEQEVLESTFALLADEEEDEGNRNALFGELDPIPLQHVSQSGGRIPLLHVHVLRVYPVTYMHRNHQGRNVFESEKSFRKHQRERENTRQSEIDQTYADVEKEVQDTALKESKGILNRNKSLNKNILNRMNPDELVLLIQALGDGCSVVDLLSPEKLRELKRAKLRQEEEIRAKIQLAFEAKLKERKDSLPVPLLKLRIMDANDKLTTPVPQNITLSIWRPDDQLQKDLVEGGAIQLKSLNPTVNSLELRLNTTSTTQFHPLARSQATISLFSKFNRTYSSLSTILGKEFSPLFMELDTAGIIVHIEDVGHNAGHTVYIADADQNILGIRLWSSITNQGLEAEIQVKNFVVFQNLQWRAGSTKCIIPCAFIQETTLVSLDTKAPSLQQALDSLHKSVKDVTRFVNFCERKISQILNNNGQPGFEESLYPRRRILSRSPSPP